MKKIHFSLILILIILVLLFIPLRFLRADETRVSTEPSSVIEPLEEAPDRTGLYLLLGVVAVFSISVGAALSFWITRTMDRRKFTDDYALEHHEEFRETIVEREAEKRIRLAKEESERRKKKSTSRKKPSAKPSRRSRKADEFDSPFIDDIELREAVTPEPIHPPSPIIATPAPLPKLAPPLPPKKPIVKYDTDGCILCPDGTKKLLNGKILPSPEYDENGEIVLWAGRPLYYDGDEPFYVQDGTAFYYYEDEREE